MSSVSIEILKKEFPNKTESQAVTEYAQKWGIVAIVKYKNSAHGGYTDMGCCLNDDQVNGYLNSPNCHEPELIYDGREKSILVTKESILSSLCSLCNNTPNLDSLVLGSGSEYSFCPNCGKFYCPVCYAEQLPLTNRTSGFGMCVTCDNEVQKAVPGDYGKIPYNSQPISQQHKAREQTHIPDEELSKLMKDYLNKCEKVTNKSHDDEVKKTVEIIICPNADCGQKLRLPTDKGNLSVTCPQCQSSFDYSPEMNHKPDPTGDIDSGLGNASPWNNMPRKGKTFQEKQIESVRQQFQKPGMMEFTHEIRTWPEDIANKACAWNVPTFYKFDEATCFLKIKSQSQEFITSFAESISKNQINLHAKCEGFPTYPLVSLAFSSPSKKYVEAIPDITLADVYDSLNSLLETGNGIFYLFVDDPARRLAQGQFSTSPLDLRMCLDQAAIHYNSLNPNELDYKSALREYLHRTSF